MLSQNESLLKQNCLVFPDTFTAKQKLRDYRKERNNQREIEMEENSGLFGSSGRVVLTAIAM